MIVRCSLLRPSRLSQALCLSLCALCGHAAAQETQSTTPAQGDMATLDKVTVAATRYNATDMQMAATNTVNVLSADDLKTTAVHNVAEALGLMPGVNVINTGQSYFGGIDGAARGEGMFSSVRGLNAEYNVNLINGINVAQGMPYSRGVQLSLLPPSGLQTIVLNKTSTADMDGDAIGGTIDYRTPSAFDSPDRQGGSVTLSGRLESRARDYGDSGLGSGAAGDWHARFGGAGQFGVSVSAYYDERHFVNSEVASASAARNDGAWKFARADASGNLAAGADPQEVLQSTGINIGYSQGQTRRYGGNAAFDWRVDPSLHLYARMTYAFAKTEQNTGYTQFVPANVSFTQIGSSGVYQPQINRVAVRYWYETNPEEADLATVQFGAEKQLGHWTFAPNIFYGTGNNDRPDHVEISARNDQYSSTNFAYGANRFISYDGDGFPVPLLTPAMQAQASDVGSLYARRTGQISKQYSGQDKGGGKFDVAYDFDAGLLSRIAFGVKYVDSSRSFTDRDWTNAKYTDGTLLRDTGLIAQRYDAVYPGQYAFPTVRLSNAALNDLIARTLTPASFDSCGQLAINNLNCNTMRATEAVSAAYAMATLRTGNWEILPGVRFEHTAITNTFWAQPAAINGAEQVGAFANNQTRYNVALPSVFVNYRPDGDVAVYRGSVWTSYTRPAFVQLGGGRSTDISSDGQTTITEGNPDLKPIKSLNVDLSGEWQNDSGGHAMLAGYYKRLTDYIYESGSNAANAGESESGNIRFVRPQNGGDGRVLGMEAAVRQTFQGLPAPLDGFGIGANITRQTTRVDLGEEGFAHERIQNAPNLLANAELFYEKGPWSVNLSYHYSGEYVSVYDYLNQGANWDNLWIKPITRVDLHLGYAPNDHLRVDLSVANLTKQHSYWAHVGHDTDAISDIVDSGMTSLLTAKYVF
ncbi:TonB-dependent receptor [Xanthomonas euvesicatoria pv. eucalypti]|uniref:TonB-dependent receptor n=1 Tax=Xanthomonas euvesicatoria TaxID=456327 RepID=UPI0026E430CA|nr:TonB-dependent receptor [Xanthomonas euvesicatoria]MDO7931912.1 TonB-dependent receptor [Xanthomonas euvesicatoria pv. eucalypti]MDO7949159.1 TonB-dependent receptor [Xanthomonas euvesicatoria pv. eucalypti]MDO7954833.1 TonB-dependent receptor [Xanthomonas euvesicatoria pv. eucalypti]MDO7957902.1 TonB-dependent receptor [Xanthomonas euvesicatoria pv. eucalypti]MDO7961325.1 TonB-dependent receptor [Xanthomonas euvesicatoria pv. eucalypti]